MGKIITSFLDFCINESVIIEQNKKSLEGDEINWDFNFNSGKFLKSEIGNDSLEKIEADFKKSILSKLTDPRLIGQVITINLIASTSKVPLGPNAKDSLKDAGYKDLTNNGLATARLDTLESIINDLLFKFLSTKDDNKEVFLKDLKNKIKIKKTPRPNIGPDYKKEADNKDDEKYKAVQKISSLIEVTGETIENPFKLICGGKLAGKGEKGSVENDFVGYEKNLYVVTSAGDKMDITFDPQTVPDCFVYKYMDQYKLSVFNGNLGGLLAEPFIAEKFNTYLSNSEKGKSIKPEKRNIGGKDYIVFDYKKVINETYNKDNALVNAINNKLKSMGIKGDVKSVQPKFFDKDGKIEVYSNRQVKDMRSGGDVTMVATTKDYIVKKIIPTPPICDPMDLHLDVVKTFVKDSLKLAVFSPCAGTAFSLNSVCNSPKE